MYYYEYQGKAIAAFRPLEGMKGINSEDVRGNYEQLYFLLDSVGAEGKASYIANHPTMLVAPQEKLQWIDRGWLENEYFLLKNERMLDDWLLQWIDAGKVVAINTDYGIQQIMMQQQSKEKYRIHIVALGDVGSTLLLGLALLGEKVIDSIGIYDSNIALCQRWEYEINQISYPSFEQKIPKVEVICKEALFDCDVIMFCASKQVPPISKLKEDVRMMQLEANKEIIAQYGKMARNCKFQGIFAVVSDPVDHLCRAVFEASNVDTLGKEDHQGLRPEQIVGFGLGVMHSRAMYFAKKQQRFQQYLEQGRAFGPHGKYLVIANSIEDYQDTLSKELTELTVEANLLVREVGYKPYIAPAISSAVIPVICMLTHQWHYSCNYLAGVYMGVRNRRTAYGIEIEHLPLPNQLYQRIEQAYHWLRVTTNLSERVDGDE